LKLYKKFIFDFILASLASQLVINFINTDHRKFKDITFKNIEALEDKIGYIIKNKKEDFLYDYFINLYFTFYSNSKKITYTDLLFGTELWSALLYLITGLISMTARSLLIIYTTQDHVLPTYLLLAKNVCEVGSAIGTIIYSLKYKKEIFKKQLKQLKNELENEFKLEIEFQLENELKNELENEFELENE
jgi:hypothetical protein